ncbi:MAG: Na(+)-translocating NADH-quinone reductase subunit C [Paraglaciecola sp.]|uniref:Na(+)-translocating NADH-quinone reductase subunit C n=1 Tax=Pseudomonadati TaxID=3379134 RepID=UPI00273EC407|nr:Na(+)-translocating NADH-quinone reductase subunit C [Paraglaciecola sp.]MDP5032556.1 Na(+)-translocating NADH-quinone reductase subunit C [Paraglaciecola sp.]MDP5129476.1 Na(+)-translocating NADH-quinone reductase subunit C [Paraglaciecola sp.]
MSAKKETLGKTIGVVLAVCLVCSIIVSGAAVGLRSLQETNADLDQKSNIIEAAGLPVTSDCNVACAFDKYVEERFVDLSTGKYVEVSDDFDMYKAAKKEDYSVKVENSNVGFQYRSSVANVFLVKDEAGAVNRIILPVNGSGLWDMMYGYLALDVDGNTIRQLVYYKQKETPGLGGEVQNPSWKAQWDGKKLYKDGEVAIQVKKNADSSSDYVVDALSGATLTSNGVQNTLDYWAGDNGYGPFLKNQTWKS